MGSIFSRLYPYKQTESKNNHENYLIEIFSFCLQNDETFRNNFLLMLNLKDSIETKIIPQKTYEGFGRPDIEIILPTSTILIECKVESKERENQLNDYVSILKIKNEKRKILVYLTKYYETKKIQYDDIEFFNNKWYDIYELIDEHCNSFSQQLKNFLTENRIAMDNNFTTLDLVSLENISGTIAKMDEVIDSISDYCSAIFGTMSKTSSRSTRLKDGGYYAYKHFGQPLKFSIDTGFTWWWEDNLVYLGVEVYIPLNDNIFDEIRTFFKPKLSGWEEIEFDHCVFIGSYRNVNEIVAKSEEQLREMTSFLKKGIDQLGELKDGNPEVFK